MKRSISSTFLSLLLLFSVTLTALPQVGYAQTGSQTAPAADYSKQLQAIEDKAEARRKELGIPGVSLVIVKDDQIIYMKGLGYKDFENKVAVTPDTQFAIGSATKAFTALSVLMSQDEGKLSLDDSPKKYLPYFKMYDAETDKNIQIRDLMCHSSGLNRTDLAMITGKLTRAELIQVAAQAKPTAKLREKFQYQNIMFTAAGEIAATVQKQSFDKLIQERIFKPLGMTNSTMSMKQMEKAKDFSFGYSYNFDTKVTEKLPFRDIDEVAPAGSINSSARDMAEWLRFVLNGGKVNGKPLVSDAGYTEWLKPQMKIAGTMNYGLGWFLQDWNGLKVVQHGGNIDGFNSMVAMIPEKKIGFVLLTNVSGSPLGNDMMQAVWSNLIELPKKDGEKLSLKTMQFMAGKYRLEIADMNMEVKIKGEDMYLVVAGQPEYRLVRTAPRQFKLEGAPDGFAVKFTPEQGDATEMYLQQPQGNYTLPRIDADGKPFKPAAATPASTAKDLVGTYSTEMGNVEIKEIDGYVKLLVPGQQPYTLVQKTDGDYSLTPLPEAQFSLKAKRDAAGKVSAIVLTQPQGVFEFKATAAGADKPKMTGDELMQKAVEASGGEAAWRKLTSRVVTFEADFENQGVKGYGTIYAKAPGKSATETNFTALGKAIGSGWEYFDGTGGGEVYTFAPEDKYTGERLNDIRLSALFYGNVDWKTLYKTIDILKTAKVGDDECYVVRFTPNAGSVFTEYYSTKTFLLRKREGVISSSTSEQKLPYSITFDDYRDIDGVKVAFKATSDSLSNGSIVTIFKDVKHNVPIDDTVFTMRKVK